jgi:hypothetical protein
MDRDVGLMLIGIALSVPLSVGIAWLFYRKNDRDMRAWAGTNARQQKDWTYKLVVAMQHRDSLIITYDDNGEWDGGIGMRGRVEPATIRVEGGTVTATVTPDTRPGDNENASHPPVTS